MGVNLFNNQTINTYALETTVNADTSTRDSWRTYAENSTKYTGRIWTDKSVDTGDVTLTNSEGNQTQVINKTQNSDFLVSLSALSSASTLVTTTTSPLDIVLVLDDSGSMAFDFGSRTEYFYLPTYNISERGGARYYALVDDQYVQIDRITGN